MERKVWIPSPEWKKKKMDHRGIRRHYTYVYRSGYTLTTPMRISSLIPHIANKGYAYEPHVAKYTYDKITKKKEEINAINTVLKVIKKNTIIL